MPEYIEREALLAHIKDLPTWRADAGVVYGRSMKYPEGMFDCKDVVSSVENATAADVAPVVHGRWVKDEEYEWLCTHCRETAAICESGKERTYRKPYCPNCGAKMDLK